MDTAVHLPPLSPEEQAHAAAVEEHIRRELGRAGGALPFDRFMDLALYAPGLGYYAAGACKLGPGGDFVTAPEISDLFGTCVARLCAPVLATLGPGAEVLELGPGSGALAAALTQALAALGCPPARYRLLEPSPDLRQRQQERLAALAPDLAARFTWETGLPAPGFRGILLANEVADAIPFQRVRLGPGASEAWWVAAGEGGFSWTRRPLADPVLAAAAARARETLADHLGGAPAGPYDSELAPAREAWLGTVAEVLAAGLILVADYGYPRREYYHPARSRGTLRCYYRHRAHDNPLVRVGLQDITAHVEFTALAEAAVAAGLTVAGFTTQAAFLLETGVLEWVAGTTAADPAGLARINQVKRLTLPGEMGEAVKLLALTRDLRGPLPGFARDQRRYL